MDFGVITQSQLQSTAAFGRLLLEVQLITPSNCTSICCSHRVTYRLDLNFLCHTTSLKYKFTHRHTKNRSKRFVVNILGWVGIPRPQYLQRDGIELVVEMVGLILILINHPGKIWVNETMPVNQCTVSKYCSCFLRQHWEHPAVLKIALYKNWPGSNLALILTKLTDHART